MKRCVLSCIMVVVVAGLVATAQAKTVKVGAAINLTGPASTWGQYHAKGHQDYFNYVNEVKGGIEGDMLELILVDTMYREQEAVAAVRKFAVRDRVDMIATWSAGAGLAAKPIVQRYKIPTINYSTSWEILQDPIDYMYLPFGSYRVDSEAVLAYIKKIHTGDGKPKVGLLTYNNAYGRSIHTPSKDYAAANGIDIVGVEEFPTKTVDLTTELLRLQRAGADYVFVQMLPSAIITAFKCADRINYSPAFFGTWTSTDPAFFEMGKGLIRDRLRIQFSGAVPTDDNEASTLMKDLWDRYKTVTSFDAAYWEGVAVAMVMERAMRLAKEKDGKIARETINAAMESMVNEEFGGWVPNVTYTPDDHEGSKTARIVQVHEDGRFVPLTNFFVPGKTEISLVAD